MKIQKEKTASLVLSMAMAMCFAACGSDSNDETNPAQPGGISQPCADGSCAGQPSGANASLCDLATQKLPASSLAWQPTFAGGCEVVQQFPLAELQVLDQQLVSMGYEKKALTQESYIYSLNQNDFTNLMVYSDTLRFTYASEFFSGNFDATVRAMTENEIQKLALLEACPTLLPAGYLYPDFDPCTSVAKSISMSWSGNHVITYNTVAKLTQAFTSLGWKCSSKDASVYGVYGYTDFTCSATLDGKKYTMKARTNAYKNETGNLTEMTIVYNR